MPAFPKKEAEAEIIALAESMVANLTANGADFPSIDATGITAALNNCKSYRQSQKDAKNQERITVVTGSDRLKELVGLIEINIRLMMPTILKKLQRIDRARRLKLGQSIIQPVQLNLTC
jgi:hypothetical protein